MTRFIQWKTNELIPDRGPVFKEQGIDPAQFQPNSQAALSPRMERLDRLFGESLNLYLQQAQPQGMWKCLETSEFERVFAGPQQTENDTPLHSIIPRADHLAIFALTLGPELSRIIEECFEENDYARGYMLDTIASQAAEMAVEDLEQRFADELSSPRGQNTVLAYSPGYCGWHISAQANVFRFLDPLRVGIQLNDSYLMIPLKSVTGVLVAGESEIHLFSNNFPFCRDCKHATCRSRMERIRSV